MYLPCHNHHQQNQTPESDVSVPSLGLWPPFCLLFFARPHVSRHFLCVSQALCCELGTNKMECDPCLWAAHSLVWGDRHVKNPVSFISCPKAWAPKPTATHPHSFSHSCLIGVGGTFLFMHLETFHSIGIIAASEICLAPNTDTKGGNLCSPLSFREARTFAKMDSKPGDPHCPINLGHHLSRS